jgi:hypothetical protein
MTMKPEQAERLISKLCRLEGDFVRRLSEYSHAAATTDRVRIAVEQDRRIPEEAGQRAIDRAKRQEADALDGLVEAIETPVPSEWDRVVKELADGGVVGNWHMVGTARWMRDLLRSYLGTRHLTHPVHREMVERYETELRMYGIEV